MKKLVKGIIVAAMTRFFVDENGILYGEIGKVWNTCEMAAIIYRSNRTTEQKHSAWKELIDRYPDAASLPNFHGIRFDSIHTRLAEIIKYERYLLERFRTPEPVAVYNKTHER